MPFDLPSWLWIVPVLTLIVFVHELGHFVTARYFGITVTEFGFGFPPRLWGVKYKETIYSINWLPLGGFVKMVGEEDPTEPGSFARQPAWKRAVVLAAGSFMNLVLPVVIFTVLFTLPHDVVVGDVRIVTVMPNSPASEAGLRAGDVITHIDGDKVDNHLDLVGRSRAKLGRETELLVRRASLVTGLPSSPDFIRIETIIVVPRLKPPERLIVESVTDSETEMSLEEARRYNPNVELGQTFREGAIGITIGTANPKLAKRSFPVWEAFPMSFGRIWDIIDITQSGISQWAAGGPDPGIAGPVGIAQVVGEVAEVGIGPLFELIALISVSLAIINILPIPALDGGRLMFVLIEMARRGKRISPQREGLVHVVGFVLLIGFVVVMSYFDVVKILAGESFLR